MTDIIDTLAVAKRHCDVFKFHDARDWAKLNSTIVGYAMLLGYNATISKQVAGHAVNAYRDSDAASAAQRRRDSVSEEKAYRKSIAELRQAYSLLKINPASAVYKARWWEGVRHRNVGKIAWNLFLEQYTKFGLRRLGLVFYSTYLATGKVYPAHKRHDWKELVSDLQLYWGAVAKAYKDEETLPIEL